MDDAQLVRISKFLSKHLRHDPGGLGLELAPGGWVSVDDLLSASARKGMRMTREVLNEVVARNSKQRFSFDETGARIRANQGHSVDVDLRLEPAEPPDTLYHGTGCRTAAVVAREGLKKMSRHHVHLSPDVETARTVGRRHGRPVVFRIDAAAMRRDGHTFYCSANGVWLVDEVPPEHLQEEPVP
jgi:putative RNA 2'-phosphotransferase